MMKFTNRLYKCPSCGEEIEGYIEDNETGECASCLGCEMAWKVEQLEQINGKEKVQFS